MKKKMVLLSASILVLTLASCNSNNENNIKESSEVFKNSLNGGSQILLGNKDNVKGDNSNSNKLSSNNKHHYVEAPEAPTYNTDGGELDVYINYSGMCGVSLPIASNIQNPITNEKTAARTILPTWRAFGDYTRTIIREATTYQTLNDNNTYQSVVLNNFKSEINNSRNIDLFYNTTSNLKNIGNQGSLVNLSDYIDVDNPNSSLMPNFSNYLKNNPEMVNQLRVGNNGQIFYTPYFDSVDDIERMFIMDTEITKKVLDSNSGWDTSKTNGGAYPDYNVLQGGFYQPFIDDNYNYPDKDTYVAVSIEGKSYSDLTVRRTKNIIKAQNELLANGCTGKELAEQFIAYIKTAYREFFKRNVYTNPSDLFISEGAAYNTDDLIALMRVVKANPGIITGNPSAEVTTFFPRAVSNNRIENIMDLAQIWGIQGLDNEYGNFYVGSDNKIHALETTPQTYDALQYLSEIYDEGLIETEFWAGQPDKTGKLDRYYKKITNDASYGFMMYDFCASTTIANDIKDGLGTKSSNRNNGFDSGYECKGIIPILAPLTYWATESNWDHDSNIKSRTGKTLVRYYESNRALKSTSWAIPSSSDNIEGAVRLMDFMFSDLGQLVCNYGPVDCWSRPNTENGDTLDSEYDASKYYVSDDLVKDELNPIIPDVIKDSIVDSLYDYYSYYREVFGSTYGIGNIRPRGLQVQTTNEYGRVGLTNIQNAIASNVQVLAKYPKKIDYYGNPMFNWNNSLINQSISISSSQRDSYSTVTGFWAAKYNDQAGWVHAVSRGHDVPIENINVKSSKSEYKTYQEFLNEMDYFNQYYLGAYVHEVNDNYKPDYVTYY